MAQMDQSMFKHAEYAVVTVSDMTRSIKFYRDALGLPLKFESKDWSEFITGTTTIALHGGGKLAPATMNKQGELLAGTCTLGFSVEDLNHTYNELKARGANFVMAPTKREGERIHLAVCADPDGLPISIAQAMPEEQTAATV